MSSNYLPTRLCLACKGKNLCGRSCPLLSKAAMPKRLGSDFFGPAASIFVGRHGYPDVFAGPVAATNEHALIDNPEDLFGMNYSDIISIRSATLRSKDRQNIFAKSRFAEKIQELAIASKPTDIEMVFRKEPSYSMAFSDVLQPMGPSVEIKKLELVSNPVIPRKTDYILSDELPATQSGFLLYQNGYNVHKLSAILSSGSLGIKKKMVPTRWSVTATDDMIAKRLMEEIRDFRVINNYFVCESQYLDNHFVMLLMPGSWEFENFESWSPGSLWASGLEILEEYESYSGRKYYAEKQAGGYYASRLAVAEGLCEMKRQARVIAFREIYDGYIIPLGVWVVRETARHAFENRKRFGSLNEALDHIKSRLKVPLSEYLKKSRILGQKRITDFKP